MFTFIGLLVSIIGTNFHLLLETFLKKLNSQIVFLFFHVRFVAEASEVGRVFCAAWLDRLSIVPAGVEIAGKDDCYLSFHYYSINIERVCSSTEFEIVIEAKAAESVKQNGIQLSLKVTT